MNIAIPAGKSLQLSVVAGGGSPLKNPSGNKNCFLKVKK